MKVKQSFYNFIVKDEKREKFIIYNSRTGALALITQEQLDELQSFVQDEARPDENKLAKQSLACGYIVPEKVDELFFIQSNIMLGRYDTTRLGLTIAPTMACNFRCPYCFESGFHTHGSMSEEVMERVVNLVERKIKSIKQLHVSWFGGEPLLAMPVIEKLTQSFHKLCKENGVDYSASIVTNGYYYTKANAEKLRALSVKSVQITIDGPKDIHDSRRFLVDGSPTFSVIMDNLIKSHGVLPVSLRINADTSNIHSVSEIVGFVKEKKLLNSVHPYLALVTNHDNAVMYDGNICLSEEEYSLQRLKFLQDNDLPVMSLYPRIVRNYCTADSFHSYVIDDRGNVTKCWNEIGNSEFWIGKLSDEAFELNNTHTIFNNLSYNPVFDTECRACKLLPICGGGCPKLRAEGRPQCHPLKGNLEEYLKASADAVECQKSNKQKAQ